MVCGFPAATFNSSRRTIEVIRLLDHPIIGPEAQPSIGSHLQGPSLIKVPERITNRLGRYNLYFADHKRAYIRLAYAGDILEPRRVHAPGSLQIRKSRFPTEPLPILHRPGRSRGSAPDSESDVRPRCQPQSPCCKWRLPTRSSPRIARRTEAHLSPRAASRSALRGSPAPRRHRQSYCCIMGACWENSAASARSCDWAGPRTVDSGMGVHHVGIGGPLESCGHAS